MNVEPSIIEEIVSKVDIVSIIGKNIKLRKSGSNYFACCPFHEEKTPSFSINSDKQFYHCFGCGESGDVITFLMKHECIEFIEAVKSLALIAGITLNDNHQPLSIQEEKQKKQYKLSLSQTLEKVASYYQQKLTTVIHAKKYLHDRGILDSTINQFNLGYAPNSHNYLIDLFPDYATNKILENSGLVLVRENSQRIDIFRDRIIFPIKNIKGDIIAFGGRVIGNGEPKYLNSPETQIFNKSNELYGLFLAQKSIRANNSVFVVEGYLDVISLFQVGITNVVATMGTAIAEEQIKLLFRICDTIYFCFDGDKAGKNASWRALDRSLMCITDSKSVNFIFLPENEDPDSYSRKVGIDGFNLYKETKSLSMSKVLLNELSKDIINIKNSEGKAKFISLVKPFILKITQAPALVVMLKKELSQIVNLDPRELESILNNKSKYVFYNNFIRPNTIINTSELIPTLNIIELLIHNSLYNPDWVKNYKLPSIIEGFSTEIKDLIKILDFINLNHKFDLISFNKKYKLTMIDLNKIINNNSYIKLSQTDFIDNLDFILQRKKRKAIKIPKIKL